MSRDRTYDFLYAAQATRVLHAPTKALETFVNGIDDIKLGIKAYSRSGN